MTQVAFANALGFSVHTLRNWEQGRRTPEGPALALLRIAARHPRVLRENLAAALLRYSSLQWNYQSSLLAPCSPYRKAGDEATRDFEVGSYYSFRR